MVNNKPIPKLGIKLKPLFINIVTSGRYKENITDVVKLANINKYMVFNIFLFVGSIYTAIFITNGLLEYGSYSFDEKAFFSIVGLLGAIILLFIIARTNTPFIVPALFTCTVYFVFCFYMIYTVPAGVASALWIYLLPAMCIFLLGNRLGLVYSVLFWVAMSFIYITARYFPYEFAIRSVATYVFTVLFSFISFNELENLNSALTESKEKLQNEHAELSVMKDNLKVGIFMIDKNFAIQPLYSRFLPQILGKTNLEHIDFLSLLTTSLQAKELGLLRDYLGMVLESSHDTKLLEDINPLYKFNYITEDGTEKILTITFASIQRGSEEKVLLGTASDITREIQMEQRLAEEDKVRQEEMTIIFEIMHASPQVLNDFIEDANYEFNCINKILKIKSYSEKQVIREVYQSIHSIKSNALIIGLESFANKLHGFETILSAYMNKLTIVYEDILSVMFELEKIMTLNDNFRTTIQKLEVFSSGSGLPFARSDILVQSIKNAISKSKEGANNDATLKVNQLDWDSLTLEYRRAIKEIIIQFTRNAMCYGIESSDIRAKKGKNEKGLLSVSIVKSVLNNKEKIFIEFSDDGKGIDFDKIRKQVKEHNLLAADADLTNHSTLIKALFMHGFSTAGNVTMHSGRGVGLSLVADRVKKLHGTIRVQSRINTGTKFIIKLPV